MRAIFFIPMLEPAGMSQTNQDSIAVVKILKIDYGYDATIDFESH